MHPMHFARTTPFFFKVSIMALSLLVSSGTITMQPGGGSIADALLMKVPQPQPQQSDTCAPPHAQPQTEQLQQRSLMDMNVHDATSLLMSLFGSRDGRAAGAAEQPAQASTPPPPQPQPQPHQHQQHQPLAVHIAPLLVCTALLVSVMLPGALLQSVHRHRVACMLVGCACYCVAACCLAAAAAARYGGGIISRDGMELLVACFAVHASVHATVQCVRMHLEFGKSVRRGTGVRHHLAMVQPAALCFIAALHAWTALALPRVAGASAAVQTVAVAHAATVFMPEMLGTVFGAYVAVVRAVVGFVVVRCWRRWH